MAKVMPQPQPKKIIEFYTQPRPRQHADSSMPGRAVNINDLRNIPDRDVALGTVLALEDFERFVFDITVLEEYSELSVRCFLTPQLETFAMRASGQLNEWRRLRAAQLSPPMVQPVDRWNLARAFHSVSQRRFKEHMAQTHTSAPLVGTPPRTAVTEYGIFWELWPQFVETGSDSQLALKWN